MALTDKDKREILDTKLNRRILNLSMRVTPEFVQVLKRDAKKRDISMTEMVHQYQLHYAEYLEMKRLEKKEAKQSK